MKRAKVLFLGEGELSGPARYLAAALRWAGFDFDHRPDEAGVPAAWLRRTYPLIVLSDYRAASFTSASRRWVTTQVKNGSGFLMVGGWASFTGLVGGYSGHPLEALLPVKCVPGDDRENRSSVLMRPASPEVPLFNTLNWHQPPIVCGYHRVVVKPKAKTFLEFRDVHFKKGKPILGPAHPALVTGAFGQGRTGAFLSDAAPHWAGGLVDWGIPRVTVHVAAGTDVEVGLDYLRFFAQLFGWLAGPMLAPAVVPDRFER